MNRYEVNGEKRTTYDVLVESMDFVEGRGESSTPSDFAPTPSYSAPKVVEHPSNDDFGGSSFDEDEFPF